MREAEFNHPRLVAVYDAECPRSREDDFFVSVVGESLAAVRRSGDLAAGDELARGERRVVDLGCGTGRLALGLAALGYRVTGVDPAAASLRRARGKAGAEGVTWVEGTSAVLAQSSYEVAVMTSHVAQFFVDEDEWRRTLGDLGRGAVSFTRHYTLADGEELLSTATLRFRSEQAIRSALTAAGFVVEDVYGGWNREPVGAGNGELLVIAHTDR